MPSIHYAKLKFKLGDNVSITSNGKTHLGRFLGPVIEKELRGTVTGFGRDPCYVRVTLKGRKSSNRYHMDFWQ